MDEAMRNTLVNRFAMALVADTLSEKRRYSAERAETYAKEALDEAVAAKGKARKHSQQTMSQIDRMSSGRKESDAIKGDANRLYLELLKSVGESE